MSLEPPPCVIALALSFDLSDHGIGNLLPKVKTGLVPVLRNVRQIVPNDGPHNISSGVAVTVVDQPVSVGNHRGGSEGRSISLRPSPSTGELGQINIELGLALRTKC